MTSNRLRIDPRRCGRSAARSAGGGQRGHSCSVSTHWCGMARHTASVTLVAGLALTACTWMAKWFYGMPGRRVMDERLAADFLRQMTRRYG